MKKAFSILVLFGFVSNAFADDWRMRKFDLNSDEIIERGELMAAGCNYKAITFFFDRADYDKSGDLDAKEARQASNYIFKSNCPKNPKPISIRG